MTVSLRDWLRHDKYALQHTRADYRECYGNSSEPHSYIIINKMPLKESHGAVGKPSGPISLAAEELRWEPLAWRDIGDIQGGFRGNPCSQ